MEYRPRQHQAVQHRDRHADCNAGRELAQHPARRGAMQIDGASGSAERGRDDERLSVQDEADMTKRRSVKNREDGRLIIGCPLWPAPERHAVGFHPASPRVIGLKHWSKIPAPSSATLLWAFRAV